MANGLYHIDGSHFCGLCGLREKGKIQCKHPVSGNKKLCPLRFHATCARQAGLEVSNAHPDVDMALMCFHHSRCDFAFRAMLEDMIEFEKQRGGNDLSRTGGSMTLDCATNIFNSGIRVIRCLGWAWQWSTWWVYYGDNWEPLLEPGQSEATMSNEELKIVESTPASRRADARKCRLAVFGAALRNREYDTKEGDDGTALHNALRAVFSTQSLVGPLGKAEIEFFVEWLGRIYRSKSPLMGLGDDKMPVSDCWAMRSPVYHRDQTPKFELGTRTLPGKQSLKNSVVFEKEVIETDDYFVDDEEIPLNMLLSPKKRKKGSESSSQKKPTSSKSAAKKPGPKAGPKKDLTLDSSIPKKRGPGRPPAKLSPPADSPTLDAPIPKKRGPGRPLGYSPKKKKSGRKPGPQSDPKKEPTLDDPIPKKDRKAGQQPDLKKEPTLDDPIPKKRGPGRPKKNP